MPLTNNPFQDKTANLTQKVALMHKPVTAWVILFLSLSLTLIGWMVSTDYYEQITTVRFGHGANDIVKSIENHMEDYQIALNGGVALFRTREDVTREEWKTYVETINIEKNLPGIQGLGFAIPIVANELKNHENEIRSQGFSGYSVNPNTERDFYTSIIYLEPFDWRNKRAFGYDMWSNEIRQEAMKRARDTGLPATSGIITLVQETEEDIQKGFLTYLPVYKKGLPIGNIEQRRKAFKGWVYSPFRAENLINEIILPDTKEYSFKIYDGDSITSESLLYSSDGSTNMIKDEQMPSLFQHSVVTIYGRNWQVQVYSNNDNTISENSIPQFIAVGGIFIDLVLFYVILALASLHKRAQTMANVMTKEVKREQKLLRTILDNIPFSIYLKDEKGKVTLVNRFESQFLGANSENQALTKLNKLLINNHEVKAEDAKVIEGEVIQKQDVNREDNLGSKYLFQVSKFPLMDMENSVESILVISEDVTSKRKAEHDLLELKNALEQTSLVSQTGGWEFNLSTQTMDLSGLSLNFFNYSKQDLPIKYIEFLKFIADGHVEKLDSLIQESIKTGKEWSFDVLIKTTNQEQKWVRMIAKTAVKNGVIYKVYGSFQDIHEQKSYELEFEKAKLKLEIATGSSRIGIWEWNYTTNELVWDQQMFALYGLDYTQKGDKAVFDYTFWLNALHPDDRETNHEIIQSNTEFESSFRIIWPDKSIHHIKAFGVTQFDEQGNPILMIGTNWDITNQKEMEVTLTESIKKAEHANNAKSEFLANMSHEIRTPLNSIIGFTDLLNTSNLDETQKRYMEFVSHSSTILLNLVSDILDLSKIEAGKYDLTIERINIWNLCEEVISTIRYHANQKGVEVLLIIPPTLPKYIFTDKIRLAQILVNLLGNALKFTASGFIKFEITKVKKNLNGTSILLFSVEDSGIGIHKEHQEKIFDAFSQEDTTTTRKFGGTGLGLTISNRLLQLFDTTLKLESEVGKGSRFYFNLEVKTEKGNVLNDIEHLEVLAEYKHVLIVDDNKENTMILKKMLEYKSIDSTSVSNGLDAIQFLAENKTDLIIMDYHMPFMDGLEVISKIRNQLKLDENANPIILLHSSHDSDEFMAKCSELAINQVLNKPITISVLYKTLVELKQKQNHYFVNVEPVQLGESKSIINEELSFLIADDNSINLFLAKSIILSILPNATIMEVEDGEAALSSFKEHKPDFVFMDIQMPKLSGYEATKAIREFETTLRTHTPIIALTAGTTKGELERCLDAGMDDYLSKPVIRSQVEIILEKWNPRQVLETGDLGEEGEQDNNSELESKMHFNEEKLRIQMGLTQDESIGSLLEFIKNSTLFSDIEALNSMIEQTESVEQIKILAHKIKGGSKSAFFEKLAFLVENIEGLTPFSFDLAKEIMNQINKEAQYLKKKMLE